jgi:protein-L-isoaspartate(D-aspartate) O-methyltransferase
MESATMNTQADQANERMVDRLIAQGALWTPRLIAAFRATPRHHFLEHIFQYQRKENRWRQVDTIEPGASELRLLYSDRALITRLGDSAAGKADTPISSSTQPSLMALMLEDLRPEPGMRVLEVGAGTGYNAALMAHVTGPGRVLTLDVDRQVLFEAWTHLRRFPQRRVELKHADGRNGFAAWAPFDRIIVTAATPRLERPWLEQLAEGGVFLAPYTLAPGLSYLIRGMRSKGVFEGKLVRPAYFMKLRSEDECSAGDGPSLGVFGSFRKCPAPWTDWLDQHPRMHWPGFTQGLAFLGMVRGLKVDYQALPERREGFGIRDQDGLGTCWFGAASWYFDGESGLELGQKIWRAFLDAGGPWLSDWRLRIDLAADKPQHQWELESTRRREIPPW